MQWLICSRCSAKQEVSTHVLLLAYQLGPLNYSSAQEQNQNLVPNDQTSLFSAYITFILLLLFFFLMCIVATKPVPLDVCSAYFCRIGNFLQLHSLLQIPLWKIRRVKAAPHNGASSLHRHGVTGGHAHTEHVPPASPLAGAESIKKMSQKRAISNLLPLVYSY